jgi:ABC-type uncharacterized transport system permease subunit
VHHREGRPHQPGAGRRAGVVGHGGFGASHLSGQWWLGVLAAGFSGALLALLHGLVQLPRVNDIATGIASCCWAPAWPSTWASR